MSDLIIVGEEAWTAEEYEARQRRLEYDREYSRRPEVRERRRIQHQKWQAANREKVRAYNRDWMRRYRQSAIVVGGLHSLACSGPTRDDGCVCPPFGKVKVYDRPMRKAA